MLKIYFMMKGQYLKTAMEYSFNFWMMAVAGVLMRSLMLGVAYVLYRNIPTIAGWREGEVYLIMAFLFISEGLCNIFFDGIWHIPRLVFGGQFDVMLARPVSPLYQVFAYEIGLQGVGVLGIGVVSLVLALRQLEWLSVFALALCLPMILLGTVVRLSTYLIGCCSVFWINAGGHSTIPFTMMTIGDYSKYPCTIYPVWMQAILFFVVPFAFIGYVPALILRGEHAPAYLAALLAAAALYFLLARAVFYRGIRKYESMGM